MVLLFQCVTTTKLDKFESHRREVNARKLLEPRQKKQRTLQRHPSVPDASKSNPSAHTVCPKKTDQKMLFTILPPMVAPAPKMAALPNFLPNFLPISWPLPGSLPGPLPTPLATSSGMLP
jgi:hypothetical protein